MSQMRKRSIKLRKPLVIVMIALASMGCAQQETEESQKAEIDVKQEIEAYMEEFVSSYMSEICGGDQKIFMQTKDIYVNEEKEYYSSQILAETYDDVLYRETTDWIILEDEIYLLQDNGEMKIEEDAPFYSIEEVKGWTEELEESKEAAEILNLEGMYDEDVVSDFLSMDREVFEKQYDKNALYEKDILYCTEEAWKYQGEQLDGFSDPKEYFDIDDIWAIRFVKPGLTEPSLNVETDHFEDVRNRIAYQCFEDYAVSMYFQEKNDVQGKPELELTELSFIKVKFGEDERREIAPRRLYELLESGYYEAREEIEAGEWAVSPENMGMLLCRVDR